MIDEVERLTFVAWTFEQELALRKEYDADFDGDAPWHAAKRPARGETGSAR